MSELSEMYFNDFIKLNRGFDLPEDKIVNGKYPIAASTSIKDYHKEFKVKAPCVTTGRSGSLGSVLYIDQDCWPLNTTLYVKDFKGNDPKYVYYFLQMMKLESFNCGAGVPSLNQNHLHKVKIKVHSRKVQPKVASILSEYDDLIENNNHRIALLEQMAEQIYKEWFVRLRFPGYENSEFKKGVPKGWEYISLGSFTNILMGQSPKSEFYNDQGDGLPFHQGVGSYGNRFPKHDTFCSVSGRLAREGDILFSVRAPVGRINIANKKLIIGRGLASIKHKVGLQSYLYYLLNYYFQQEDVIGNGSIFNSVGKDELNNFKILHPSNKLDKKFDDIVSSIDLQIKVLIEQIQILKQTRDLLLPRLISGKLIVKDVEIKL